MLLFPRESASPRGTGRPRRAARGFTLLELVVVAALASILFTVLVRWTLTLASASTSTLDNASSRRVADVALDAFAEDVRAARSCQSGAPSPLVSIGPASVSFTRTSDTGGEAQVVTWTVAPTTGGGWSLTRATVEQRCDQPMGTPLCLPSTAPTSTPTATPTATSSASAANVCRSYADAMVAVQTDRILAGDDSVRPAFYALTEGQAVTDPQQAWGKCADGATEDRCFAAAVGLNWTFVSPGDASAPVSISRLFTFPAATAGVS